MPPEGYYERYPSDRCRCFIVPVFSEFDPVAEAEAICRDAASP